ncbi:hypothetical protein BH20ACI2_BH20ACI2_01160 [soil metagenome]
MTKTLTFGVFILSIILTGSVGLATAQIASEPQSPAPIVRQGSGKGDSTPNAEVDGLRITTAREDLAGATTVRKAPGDFNGDGKTDFSIVRPGPGEGSGTLTWWIRLNGPNTFSGTQWGFNSDFIVPADFDGDGKDDIAIWRRQTGNSGFYVIRSSDNTFSFTHIGQPGDDPLVVADYTGDGVDDPAIYRAGAGNGQSFFWYSPSSGPFVGQFAGLPWGMGGDIALIGDYNGDGVADFTVARVEGNASVVYTMFGTVDGSVGETRRTIWGLPSDIFVPGDYDGDGKTDLAVTRWVGSTVRWIYLPSSGAPIAYIPWGLSNGTDLEAHGDYDGDGITDLAIWRTSGTLRGYFIVRLSGGGVLYEHWGGLPGDAPTIWEFK